MVFACVQGRVSSAGETVDITGTTKGINTKMRRMKSRNRRCTFPGIPLGVTCDGDQSAGEIRPPFEPVLVPRFTLVPR